MRVVTSGGAESAVQIQHTVVCVLVLRQEQGCVCHLFSMAKSPQRYLTCGLRSQVWSHGCDCTLDGNMEREFCPAGVVHTLGHLGFNVAWKKGVHADARRSHLRREGAGQT